MLLSNQATYYNSKEVGIAVIALVSFEHIFLFFPFSIDISFYLTYCSIKFKWFLLMSLLLWISMLGYWQLVVVGGLMQTASNLAMEWNLWKKVHSRVWMETSCRYVL